MRTRADAAAGGRGRRRHRSCCPTSSPALGEVHRPEHFAVANAIGAAIAQVGGEVDRVFAIEPGRRDAGRSTRPGRRPSTRRSRAGAQPATRRDRRRRRGAARRTCPATPPGSASRPSATSTWGAVSMPCVTIGVADPMPRPRPRRGRARHRRRRRPVHRARCSPSRRSRARAGHASSTLDEVPDDALVVPVAMMGAPTVMVEKLPAGDEVAAPVEALAAAPRRPGHAHRVRSRSAGVNSIVPVVAAAAARAAAGRRRRHGPRVPRAADGAAAPSPASRRTPMAIADEKGNTGVLHAPIDNRWAERFARVATVEMGCSAMIAAVRDDRRAGRARRLVAGTLSLCVAHRPRDRASARGARRPGRARSPSASAAGELFAGKVVDVERRTDDRLRPRARRASRDGDDAAPTLVCTSRTSTCVARARRRRRSPPRPT